MVEVDKSAFGDQKVFLFYKVTKTKWKGIKGKLKKNASRKSLGREIVILSWMLCHLVPQ